MKTKVLKNYEMKAKPVGKGCSSHVYLARDMRKFAIKELVNIKMAKHEATVMESYRTHPFLPKFYELLLIDEKAYIVMEFCEGERIGHWNFHSKGQIRGREKAIAITLNILRGLQHLHNKGFIHYDILPKNVLIADNDPERVKIIDFGISKPIDYIEKNPKYKNKDLYEAALMCIYLINGSVSKAPIEDLETLDDDLKEVLYKGVNPNKEKQYSSTEEFIRELIPLL
ncbi:protein kinase domain-containing protein [Halonatronum saccharophilum]|uniref:protein kinase domain-containing protein n=1 Tax=Halonatronum saccharophilum TaxID=150060 RepID=UPI00048638EA|nr:protein kinase [Halonatronum saccharophilum]